MHYTEDDSFWSAVEPFLFDAQRLDQAAAEAEAACELLEVAPGADLLDLCTGIGRHAVPLAQRGYHVTGVDRTAGYLARARVGAQVAGVDVEWVQADAREFCRPASFDGAINLFTSFGLFDDPADDRKVLDALRRSLRPGAGAVFELFSSELMARDFRERDWQETEDGKLLLEQRKLGDQFEAVHNVWRIIDGGAQQEFTVSLRLYSGPHFKALLLAAGFERVQLFGSLQGAPYDQDAERLVAVARLAPSA